MSERVEHDRVIEKFFKKGKVPSDEKDWDYVVISYMLNGELVQQETELSPEMSDLFEENDDTLAIGESISIPNTLSTQTVQDENWTATGSKIDSQPSMHGEEGWAGTVGHVRGYENEGKQDRIFELPPHYVLETEGEKMMAVYVRSAAFGDLLCQAFDGKRVNLLADSFRPIPPSEDPELTNTVVNCKCYWRLEGDISPQVEKEEQSRGEDGKYRVKPEPYHEGIMIPPSTVSRWGKYTRTAHDDDDICTSFEGKIYDLSKKQRPVPPSEGKGYTNTHPNCKCYFEPVDNPEEETRKMAIPTKLDLLTNIEKKHVHSVHRKIGQRAKNHTLHTVFEDGHLSKRTRGTNPMKEIRETLQELHNQFNWFTPDYLEKVSQLDKSVGGKFVLVRASAETITDHRSEGEPYRRLLKGEELMQLTRTGIGKSTDINHLGKEFEVDSQVLDAEYDPIRKESQMLVHLKDPEIIHFINTGQIASVSINAGAPRRMDTECDTGECFVVPTGLILGELDGIAFTWVVDDPAGIVWRGKYVPRATAGVKTTKIEII